MRRYTLTQLHHFIDLEAHVTNPDKLTLIVPYLEGAAVEGEPTDEDAEKQALPDFVTRFGHRAKEVDLHRLEQNLAKVQGEIAELLRSIDVNAAGYRLKTIEVSLAISAEGGIGVVTAGMEASLSLSFEPTG
ncbi:MAG: hypothetical protein HOQ28_02970 [Thermoleophilia bacterium]|nr:hypothetical protein [Thermoleophilia bacterium]